jgi:hypothetical protein
VSCSHVWRRERFGAQPDGRHWRSSAGDQSAFEHLRCFDTLAG